MNWLKRRILVWKKVIWGRTTAVFTGLWFLIGLILFIRDELLPPEYQEKWRILKLIPDWSWYFWIILGLVVVLGIVLEGAYREIESLNNQLSDKNHRAIIGGLLKNLYVRGQGLRSEIVNSTDELSISESREKYQLWREGLRTFLPQVSEAKAQYVDGISSVKAADIGGMKSQATREEKIIIVLHIDARLQRLGEIMKEY